MLRNEDRKVERQKQLQVKNWKTFVKIAKIASVFKEKKKQAGQNKTGKLKTGKIKNLENI